MADSTNIHAGHRGRLKDIFASDGITALTDERALEMLLFYVIPRSDTYPLACRLIDTFGSLRAVLSASPEELKTVNGFGDSCVLFLDFVHQLFERLSEDEMREYKTPEEMRYNSPDDLSNYFVDKLSNCPIEQAWLVCFDGDMYLKHAYLLGEGTATTVAFNPQNVIKFVNESGCKVCAIGHNHPTEGPEPSNQDISSTIQLKALLKKEGITLMEHIIVGNGRARGIVTDGIEQMLR
ncbi:MAG: hypothetical protein LUG49_08765 [Oscillospiraceae bacterium]|nr:hypothetical protein [Oscillospiraceae bacterium]